jgi:ubiquinone/menaquinone biosynthesis C-methylase UbiE
MLKNDKPQKQKTTKTEKQKTTKTENHKNTKTQNHKNTKPQKQKTTKIVNSKIENHKIENHKTVNSKIENHKTVNPKIENHKTVNSKFENHKIIKIANPKIETRLSLIVKDKYFHFIDILHKHNIENRICLVESLKNYYNYYNNNYPNIQSNKQFQYFIHECFKNNYINQLNRLIILLSSYLTLDDIYFLINMIKILNIESDNDVYLFIKSKKYKIKNSINIYTKCSNLDMGFERILENCEKYIKPSSNYLDFGCGNGIKTLKFQSLFKISLKNTYGTDINEWGPYSKTRKFNFNFKFLKNNNKIDFLDNTFDLVTCFLTLHHIPNLTETLNEIKRVLKPNGLLFILDHNVFINLDAIILDLQHNLYAYINNEPNKQIFNRFFNYLEWDYVLYNMGFIYKFGHDYSESVNILLRYDYQFYGLYENKK